MAKPASKPVKRRDLRMMWNSNSVWAASGYGIFQRDLMFRLLGDGWPVAQSAFYGLDGCPIIYNGLPVYPKMQDMWGSDAMVYHSKHFNAHATFSMQDIWPLNPQFLSQLKTWIPYLPIDQEPVPINVLNNLKYAYKVITFSKFGQKALAKAGYSSTLILEGTDTNIFKPMDKAKCRALFNLPQDKFIVGMIGANKPDMVPRKGWQEALDAFKLFHDAHPESIFFYHTNQPGGFPIKEYAKMLGFPEAIFFIDEYLAIYHAGSDVTSSMYNAFDILIHPSTTEGFGLCVVEAQSCGTPVIVNNCTSMPELVIEGETGEITKTARKQLSPALGYIYFADVQSLYEKMEKLYKADREKMGQKAREHVLKNYNIDTIFKEQWVPLLEELQEELIPLTQGSESSIMQPVG